jgi:serine protease AprX
MVKFLGTADLADTLLNCPSKMTPSSYVNCQLRAVCDPRRCIGWLALLMVMVFARGAMAEGRHAAPGAAAVTNAPNAQARRGKLDRELTERVGLKPSGQSRIIVTLQPGANLPEDLKRLATKSHRKLGIINGEVLTVPNSLLKYFESNPSVFKVDFDRPLVKSNFRTTLTIGARPVQSGLGLTGAGVGVAILDSGIASWHDDLTNRTSTLYPYGDQRVSAFVDFVNGQIAPYDDEGHGTHVAGIIAGNGFDSLGQKAGVAPDASLVVLKVLDANGGGTISNIIAAFDWIVANHTQYNIRVVNASVGATIHESYWTDPLTLAAKRVVDAGVAVVAAAGNRGKNAAGLEQFGGITAPGNAPWVITVGASSTNGTPDRADDVVAGFSSRGPTYRDWSAKPDLVAPGVGTVSLAAPHSTFSSTKAQFLLPGSVSTADLPYLALSGTSMAAPVVAGTIALMMQANPALTPNMAKAILEYTAQPDPILRGLVQGAGFLNTLGAVRLARFFATAAPGQAIPTQSMWGKKLLWGNHMLSGGMILPAANAFRVGTDWGAASTADQENIIWGTDCQTNVCENIIWGTDTAITDQQNIIWGTQLDALQANIIWGTNVGDVDENIVWGTDCGSNDCENIVWGTTDAENILWGTATDQDNILWGTACTPTQCVDANIIWGTDDQGDQENIVWGTADQENILWGTADQENIIWGTDEQQNIVWGTLINGVTTWFGAVGEVHRVNWSDLLPTLSDEQVFALLKTITTTAAPLPPPPDTRLPPTSGDQPPQVTLPPSSAPPPPTVSPDPSPTDGSSSTTGSGGVL